MIWAVALAFFLLPMIAGMLVRWLRPGILWMRLLLSFSGAFLLGVVFLHMLPELYEEAGMNIGFWILGGFLLQVILEFFSHGIEHGHVHVHSHGADATLPLLTLLSLCIHSFAEGMPFADPEVAGDVHFLAGVLLHKMPMAVALATVLTRSHVAKGKSVAMLGIFAIAAPLGIFTGHIAGEALGHQFLQSMLGLAIGMLLHISTTIIFESSPEHRFVAARFLSVLIGAALAAFSIH
ncbi:MAG: ZIP family metal transporter [Bacteroidota bacterium]|nr:ZIP family metal transporter [Bacteroidota bacterium]